MLFNSIILFASAISATAASDICLQGCCGLKYKLPSTNLRLHHLATEKASAAVQVPLVSSEILCCPCEDDQSANLAAAVDLNYTACIAGNGTDCPTAVQPSAPNKTPARGNGIACPEGMKDCPWLDVSKPDPNSGKIPTKPGHGINDWTACPEGVEPPCGEDALIKPNPDTIKSHPDIAKSNPDTPKVHTPPNTKPGKDLDDWTACPEGSQGNCEL